MLLVISLSFILLPELVKHILVAGVVRRNIKFSVKISYFSMLKVVRDCCGEVLVSINSL